VPRFQPEEIFRVLDHHEVEYVVIGGIAATLHGSNLRTGDVDICPSRSPQNLSRLASALKEMDARIRTADVADGLPFACDAEFIAGIDLLNLVTRFGDFDISFVPAGTAGYEDLARQAMRIDLEPVIVPVASLEDVIRSKRAAGRPKDLQQLPTLELLLEELRKRGEQP
jgi:predicted nucleotidyltransferase